MAGAVPVAQPATLDRATLRDVPTARTTALFLHTRSAPFADSAVRAAAREAVDGSALAEDVYEGHADTGRGLFGPALTWAVGKPPRPSGRPAAARVRNAPITLATYDDRPELPEVTQVLQQQLRKAGSGVKLEVREYSRLESGALAGKFDAVVAARNTMLGTGDPVSCLTRRLHLRRRLQPGAGVRRGRGPRGRGDGVPRRRRGAPPRSPGRADRRPAHGRSRPAGPPADPPRCGRLGARCGRRLLAENPPTPSAPRGPSSPPPPRWRSWASWR
ncbi:hypothetical protein Z951_10115 [Streptomyces sp. PRh5]|nr:hypothetical protein Z951_10115 [Streptomyces sp. PRh5]